MQPSIAAENTRQRIIMSRNSVNLDLASRFLSYL